MVTFSRHAVHGNKHLRLLTDEMDNNKDAPTGS